MSKPPILILHATGTNRDREAAWACELAGGAPEIVHVNRLAAGEVRLADYRMVILPGGFSYGDDLGAGKVWAVSLRYRLADDLAGFVASGRPVLGICNGFQALVKAGVLPGRQVAGVRGQELGIEGQKPGAVAQTADHHLIPDPWPLVPAFTLARNDSARFECRWVHLAPNPASPCIFTRGLAEPIYCPVAHGEGKFVAASPEALAGIEAADLPALRYSMPQVKAKVKAEAKNLTSALTSASAYPWNPNGSQNAIAGICNPQGNVLGLMPHPEDHIIAEQHPGYHRGHAGNLGLPLFANGVRYAMAI